MNINSQCHNQYFLDNDETMHYWLRRPMGFEKYKKWTKVDTCFSLSNPTKQEI